MPIDIHGLQKRYKSMGNLDLPSIMECVKEFRASLQGRKKELLEPFGLDNLDKFKDDPAAFVESVSCAVEAFREKKEQDAPYKKIYEDDRCLITFTTKPEGAAAAGSHLKIYGEVKCPWCICVKHPENEKWWKQYEAVALFFIYAKDDACCVLVKATDAVSVLDGTLAYSQVEGIENKGLNAKPEEQRKVLERLYGKTGLTSDRLVEILSPALKPMEKEFKVLALAQKLLAAADGGDLERVKECLDAGAHVDARDKDSNTPLHLAALKGHLEVCKLLLDRGADATARSSSDSTPLHKAANNGHLEICKLLLDAGADVDTVNEEGTTPLLCAGLNGHAEVCKTLLDAGADASFKDGDGWPLLYWVAGKGHFDICKMLLDAGAEVDGRTWRGHTPLMTAVLFDYLDICKLLIEAGADVNARNLESWTPLLRAATNGRLEVCKLLIDAGADVNALNESGCTALHYAAWGGHFDVCKLLIDAGADVDGRDENGLTHYATPLSLARSKGHTEVERLLLQAGGGE